MKKKLLVGSAVIIAVVVASIIGSERPAKRPKGETPPEIIEAEEPSRVPLLVELAARRLADNMSIQNLESIKEQLPADLFDRFLPVAVKSMAKSIIKDLKKGDKEQLDKKIEIHRLFYEFGKNLLAEVGRQYYLLHGDPTMRYQDRYPDVGVDYGFSVGELIDTGKLSIVGDWLDLSHCKINNLNGIQRIENADAITSIDLSYNQIEVIQNNIFFSIFKCV